MNFNWIKENKINIGKKIINYLLAGLFLYGCANPKQASIKITTVEPIPTGVSQRLQRQDEILNEQTVGKLKYGAVKKEKITVMPYVDLNSKKPRVVVDVVNDGKEGVLLEKVKLYCNDTLTGIKVLKSDYAVYFKLVPGEKKEDIIDYFESQYNRALLVDLVCAGVSRVEVITTTGNKFTGIVEVIE